MKPYIILSGCLPRYKRACPEPFKTHVQDMFKTEVASRTNVTQCMDVAVNVEEVLRFLGPL